MLNKIFKDKIRQKTLNVLSYDIMQLKIRLGYLV